MTSRHYNVGSDRPRCPDCRTRRASWASLLAHIASSGHAACTCLGYAHPHRPESPLCDSNIHAPLRKAERAATRPLTEDERAELMIECSLNPPARRPRKFHPQSCPF